MKFFKLIILSSSLLVFSQNVFAYNYGCGFQTSSRQAVCVTQLASSEFGTYKQVAVRVTTARGSTYNYGSSNWSLGRSDIRYYYFAPNPRQTHTVGGRHCVQFYNNLYECKDSSYSQYF